MLIYLGYAIGRAKTVELPNQLYSVYSTDAVSSVEYPFEAFAPLAIRSDCSQGPKCYTE